MGSTMHEGGDTVGDGSLGDEAAADQAVGDEAVGGEATGASTAAGGDARPLVVAVDGPSGSGKSSVCRKAAARLGLAYLDTGAMYRAATWWCLEQGVDLADAALVAATVRTMVLEMGLDPHFPTFQVAGHDIGTAIRAAEISTVVSAVATNLDVRADLGARQRRVIEVECLPQGTSDGRGVVVEGRDITTVIAPDADVRILLTASEEARLARRARELHGVADASALAATRDQVVRRDAQDSTVVEFQTAADGVVTVDSSDLDLEQTVEAVLEVVARVAGRTA
ncbi:(d)CMP kinase [Actinotalea subterranea]|uniref:(d)CMP kinase n=1 Tax=Actinotalea subterranea TaxID=2607497 RepID=UPI001FE8ADA6|nr:(d)CMP kinase [Actinotalea subterranea]